MFLAFILVGLTAPVYSVFAQETSPKYQLLAPLPCSTPGSNGCDASGKLTTFDPSVTNKAGENSKLGEYLNIMIRLFIGICAVLAVIMIVVGGIEYMTSELPGNKGHGKETIMNAIFGLLLALGSWLILFTINPDLLKTDLSSLKEQIVRVDLGGESATPFTPISPEALAAIGITCSGGSGNLSTISQSFVGHSNYSQSARNTISGGKVNVDCSSFVSQVYVCAGLSNPGGTTAGIFGPGTRSIPVTSIGADGKTLNGLPIQVGDLLGWRQGENNERFGHVMMYIGNGQVIDAQGQGGVAARPLNSPQFQGRITYVNRYP